MKEWKRDGRKPNLLHEPVQLLSVLGKEVSDVHLPLLVTGESGHQTPLPGQHPSLQHPHPVFLVVVVLVLASAAKVQVARTNSLACDMEES